MTNQVSIIDDFDKSMVDLEQTHKMCAQLMKTPHFARMGEAGIYTILQKARSIGLNPLDALQGGMYFVQGKVELSANTMNFLIRRAGHSITKDEASTPDCCILRGKRTDTGDTWTASFSIAEAKRAGIFKATWEKYPEDMLFARALTRLARQLFPDVIRGCYVEGEIRDAYEADKVRVEEPAVQELISKDQASDLFFLFNECTKEDQAKAMGFLKKFNVGEGLEGLPLSQLERVTKALMKYRDESKADLQGDVLDIQAQ